MVATINVIMTRPAGSNSGFVARLAKDVRDAIKVFESPLIEIRPLDTAITLDPDETVIFTSANAVALAPDGNGRRAFCVGARTTDVAKARGWQAECAGQDAGELVGYVISLRDVKRAHHLSGVHLRGEVAERLRTAGINMQHTAIYDQVLLPLTSDAQNALEGSTPIVAPLFSQRTAAHFAACTGRVSQLDTVVLSAAVGDALPDAWKANMTIARKPDASSMVEAVEKLVRMRRLA